MKIKIVMLFLCVLMQGCSTVDDYMLGKDNTPKPKDMEQIQSKIKMSQNWSVAVAKPHKTNDYLKLKPVIIGDNVYIADVSGIIQNVSANNGRIKWTAKLKHAIVSGPTVADGYIAVGTSASTLALFRQADGQKLWQIKVSGEVLSPPAISNKKVIAKTIDGKVFAFDVTSGKQ
ncbi:MAG: PQQ-binding-like beta-propeller repeat protein, partial [Legionellales bacterium]